MIRSKISTSGIFFMSSKSASSVVRKIKMDAIRAENIAAKLMLNVRRILCWKYSPGRFLFHLNSLKRLLQITKLKFSAGAHILINSFLHRMSFSRHECVTDFVYIDEGLNVLKLDLINNKNDC